MEYGVIITFFNNVIGRFVSLYRKSLFSDICLKTGDSLKKLFSASGIWRFVSRPEKANGAFDRSLFKRSLNAVFRLPITLTAKIARRLPGSITEKLVRFLIPAYTSFLGVFIFIQTVIPHQYWKNIYGLILVIALYLLYVVKCALSEGYECDIGKLDAAFIIFVLACALSTVFSIELIDSLRVFAYNLIPIFFVFIFVNAIKTRREMTTIIHFIIGGVTIASLYGIYQYIVHVPVDVTLVDVSVSGSISRISGTMGNPNNYAEYLVLCLPFFAASFLNSRSVRAKIFTAGLGVLPMINLFLTSSRSAWLAFAAAIMVYLFLKKRNTLPLVILGAILTYQFLPASITDRIATIGRDSSSQYRIPIWEASLRMLKDYWVTGLGTGPLPYMRVFSNYSNMIIPPHSHMLPLQIWLEFGLAGIASFVWLIARLIKKGMNGIFKMKDAYYDNISAAAIASLTGILIVGIFEYVWFYPRVMNMFWIVIAIFIAALNASSKIK